MSVKRLVGRIKTLGDRQVRVVATTGVVDRVGDIVNPRGGDFTDFMKNPVCLRDHDASRPVARCLSIIPYADRVEAIIQFPEEGTSEDSDECYKLVKQRILGAVSIGFIPDMKSAAPLQSGGLRFDKWTLLEVSIVALPANAQALIVERRAPGRRTRRHSDPELRRIFGEIDRILADTPSKRLERLVRQAEADKIARDVQELLERTK
jgi:HK97 family phage prohead protease